MWANIDFIDPMIRSLREGDRESKVGVGFTHPALSLLCFLFSMKFCPGAGWGGGGG